jgi:arylsulfatase
LDHTFLLTAVKYHLGEFLMTFKDYPPRQKAASFTIDQALEMLEKGASGK